MLAMLLLLASILLWMLRVALLSPYNVSWSPFIGRPIIVDGPLSRANGTDWSPTKKDLMAG